MCECKVGVVDKEAELALAQQAKVGTLLLVVGPVEREGILDAFRIVFPIVECALILGAGKADAAYFVSGECEFSGASTEGDFNP